MLTAVDLPNYVLNHPNEQITVPARTSRQVLSQLAQALADIIETFLDREIRRRGP